MSRRALAARGAALVLSTALVSACAGSGQQARGGEGATTPCDAAWAMNHPDCVPLPRPTADELAAWLFWADAACALGEPDHCWDAALAYAHGLGAAADTQAALERLELGCRHGGSRACLAHEAGELTELPWPLPRAAATVPYATACADGHTPSCTHLGARYLTGDGVAADRTLAEPLLARGCEAGDPVACGLLSAAVGGEHGLPVDGERAHALLLRACRLGDGESCFRMGVRHVQRGRPSDGQPWMERACAQGSAEGCAAAGLLLLTRFDGKPADTERALDLVGTACRRGDAPSCRFLRGMRRSHEVP
mgnify:FL=1